MAGFMLNTIHISSGLEIVRIQSVEVTGTPCFFLNTDWENLPNSATKKLGISRRWMTAPQWHSHVMVLRNFSQAAVKAVKTQDPVSIEGQRGSVLVRGPSPIAVTSPLSHDCEQLVLHPEKVSSLMSCEDVCPPSPSVSMSVQHGSNSVDPSSASVSSFGSITRLSNDTLVAASPLRKSLMDGRSGSVTSIGSMSTASVCSNIQQRVVIPHQKTSSESPPNVFIFSESSVSVESVKMTLSSILHKQRYTVYPLNLTQMLTTPWQNQASLVVVSGSVPASLVPRLVSFVLKGKGRLLCLCSDLLGTFLPPFRTAEVRPDELVTFSYSTWKHVSLMHHIFCYQPSPTPAKFSQDEQSIRSGIPNSVEIQDTDKRQHTLDVKVLGAEETWQTPSLILATSDNGGKIIFSQVHLEVDPMQYENDESKHKALRSSDKARVEILIDLLSTHLGLKCGKQGPDPKYTPAYFLGTHELKLEFMESLKGSMDDSNTLKLTEIMVKFCGKGVSPPEASSTFMPVMMYACPDSFSTVIYFENLNTKKLGRLVIYSKVMASAALLLDGRKLAHGLAVIPYTQTKGISNCWLSPDGCATFSIQLHIPIDSVLGQNLTLLQHLVTVATVSSICSIPGLENLDVCLKWPNDIYAGKLLKIGGSTLRCIVHNRVGICNVSLGLNLSNKEPTTCINDMITELNKKTGSSIASLSHEKFFAIVFTELERIVDLVQNGQIEDVISLYYKYWLHSNAEATVIGADGSSKTVQIVGIDYLGALRVHDQLNDEYALHPDENSFDMQSAIIAPKV
ncbi:biotin--protein ligase isoform X2 [Nilaparvata lugens]|nr:biotin--protein ligase isoform X2 [Nilaparvata lugens]